MIFRRKFIKKVLSVLLTAFFVVSISAVPAAAEDRNKVSIEYMEDGSYFVTTIVEGNSLTRASRSGSKFTSYYDGSGTKKWTLTVTGSFSYTGSSSMATSASGNLVTHVSGCSVGSKGSYTSGNAATAYATVDGISKSVTLKCSVSGVLS